MNISNVQCAKCHDELSWVGVSNSNAIRVCACSRCRDKETAENNVTVSIPALLKMLDDNEVLR